MKRSGKDVQAEFLSNTISGRMFLQYFLSLLCPERDKLPEDGDRDIFRMREIIACFYRLFSKKTGTDGLLGQPGQRHYRKEANLASIRPTLTTLSHIPKMCTNRWRI